MVDVLAPKSRQLNMRRTRSCGSKPEMVVRRGLHRLGFRFRLHDRGLPGSPDLVLPRYRALIFVNGCFWHRHDCDLFKLPETRIEFWDSKLRSNACRDTRNRETLLAMGWRVARVWECSLKGKRRLGSELVIQRCHDFLLTDSLEVDIRGDPSRSDT